MSPDTVFVLVFAVAAVLALASELAGRSSRFPRCFATIPATHYNDNNMAGDDDGVTLLAAAGARQASQAGYPAFFLGYALATTADWLQGPYMFQLYQGYGYSEQAIAGLFVCGFSSSGILGSWMASQADRYGRRRGAAGYGLLYALSCALTIAGRSSLPVLLAGRLAGGLSTSLLFSVFEAWLVGSCHAKGVDPARIAELLGLMSLLSGVTAILAGLLAQAAVAVAGVTTPFWLSMLCSLLCSGVVLMSWEENYGARLVGSTMDVKHGLCQPVLAAVASIHQAPSIACLVIVQALFEASMYTWVFLWVPALQHAVGTSNIPAGVIFSTYMLSWIIGSALYRVLIRVPAITSSHLGLAVVGVAAIAMLAAWALVSTPMYLAQLLVFCVFEACVGAYFPSIAAQRSDAVPDAVRAALPSLGRMPLNAMVVAGFLSFILGATSISVLFLALFLSLLLAAVAQLTFLAVSLRRGQPRQARTSTMVTLGVPNA